MTTSLSRTATARCSSIAPGLLEHEQIELSARPVRSPESAQRRLPEDGARSRAATNLPRDVEPRARRPSWSHATQRFRPTYLWHITTELQLEKPEALSIS